VAAKSVDIGYDLTDGIFNVLNGNVIYDDVEYPVYKSIPKAPASLYVFIGDIISIEDGTKDSFIYTGSIRLEVVDERNMRADKKIVYNVLSVVRGLLKVTKGHTFSIGDDLTLVVFSHEPLNTFTEISDTGISRIRLIDNYNFVIN